MADDVPPASPLRDGHLLSVLAWQSALVRFLMQAQRNQYQVLAAWEKTVGTVNQDLWDQWVCRYAGGVPLDG
jgi:hypothetical protein